MKLTGLAVITLLVLACSPAFAASGSFSLGFLSYDASTQYCDYEVLSFSDPFIAGTHNLTTVCGFPYDGAMVGLKSSIPTTTGLPVTGAGYGLADNTFDAQSLAWTGCQIEWFTKAKAATAGQIKNFKYTNGWEYMYTCGGGGDYFGNYGFLTSALGARVNVGAPKTSFGRGTSQRASKDRIIR